MVLIVISECALETPWQYFIRLTYFCNQQKQLFADVLQNRYSQFRSIQRKTPVLESLSNKVGGQACNFIKKRLKHSCFPVNIANFFE